MAVGRSNFLTIKKFSELCWDLNPRPLVYEASAFTTTITWQVKVKGVKVCAQQSMSNHLPVGSWH